MTKCTEAHVDNILGVRLVREPMYGQVFYHGFDLVEACPRCKLYKNDVDAANALLRHRFGVEFRRGEIKLGRQYYANNNPEPITAYGWSESMRALMRSTLVEGRRDLFGSREMWVAWICSSHKPFVRQRKDTVPVPTIQGVVKVSSKVPMLKVPGRRAAGYLKRTAAGGQQ